MIHKVFVEDKPIYFTNQKDTSLIDGELINENYALKHRNSLLEKHLNSDKKSILYILTENPESCIHSFFNDYSFIEAAGGIVKNGDTYLFIKRHGLWDIPKGKMEQGETPSETALREVEEECGIDNLQVESLITVTYHTYPMKGENVLKKTYWFSLNHQGEKDGKPQSEEGISEISWLKSDQISAIKKNTYESIIDVLDVYFGMK